MKFLNLLQQKDKKQSKPDQELLLTLTSKPFDETDYYLENGYVVFTENYHKRRGYCCGSGCRHCPFQKE